MFKSVSSRLDVPAMEEGILNFWEREQIFKKTFEQRQGRPEYVFFEGPPTANGRPGTHHVLARAFKDMFPATRSCAASTSRGAAAGTRMVCRWRSRSRRSTASRQKTPDRGIRHRQVQRGMPPDPPSNTSATGATDRPHRLLGRPEDAYVTFTNEYIESVWWILKSFGKKTCCTRAIRSCPIAPAAARRFRTMKWLSATTKPRIPPVFVRFPLCDKKIFASRLDDNALDAAGQCRRGRSSRRGLRHRRARERWREGEVHPGQGLVEKVFKDEEVKVLDTFKGKKLKGQKYRPLFTFLPPDKPAYYRRHGRLRHHRRWHRSRPHGARLWRGRHADGGRA